jgi:hypothetical protein
MGDGIGVFELALGVVFHLHSLLCTMSSLEAGSEILESAQKKAETEVSAFL